MGRQHPHRIPAAAWTVLVLGLAVTAVSSVGWYRSLERQGSQSFNETAASVSALVSTQLGRSLDLLTSIEGLVVAQPEVTNAEFLVWYRAGEVDERFPGGIGFGYIERVPADELAAFSALRNQDPVVGLEDAGPFTVVPDHAAPEYCLQKVGVWKRTVVEGFAIPPGLDFCAAELPGYGPSPLPGLLGRATAEGTSAVGTFITRGERSFEVFTPVYRGGTKPRTAAARVEALEGWASGSFDAERLVHGVLPATEMLPLEVVHHGAEGPSTVVSHGSAEGTTLRYGAEVPGTDGEWSVTVFGRPDVPGPPAATQTAVVAAVGLGVTALLFLVVQLLGSSRRRALALVDEKTAELVHQALHDGLTGLPNRELLLDRATRMLERARRHGGQVAALFVDLDNFKSVNDTLGHSAGDELLRVVGERLASALRGSDTVGRIGGDEFVVLIEDPARVGGAATVASRLATLLHEPVELGDRVTPVSASIGVAVGLPDRAEDLLRDADVAMYEAKAAGKGSSTVFRPDMQAALQDRLDLEWDLFRAVEDDELFLLYQPTFDLRTRRVAAVEALLRWRHPTRGVIEAGEVLDVAQRAGLMAEIGRWVLEEACGEAARWAASGHRLPVSVNVALGQLQRVDVVGTVRGALSRTGLDPELLCLEVSEDALARDGAAVGDRLGQLAEMGVRLTVDGFGTGYSVAGELGRLPFGTAKIDRSVLQEAATSPEGAELVGTLVRLGRTLGLGTVAAGIEDRAQLDEALRERCDLGQGHYLSRPLSAEALLDFLGGTTVGSEDHRDAGAPS